MKKIFTKLAVTGLFDRCVISRLNGNAQTTLLRAVQIKQFLKNDPGNTT